MAKALRIEKCSQCDHRILAFGPFCSRLKKDIHIGQPILPDCPLPDWIETYAIYGCHVDGDVMPDCVIDNGRHNDCAYAKEGMRKEQCEYWKIVVKEG